MAPPAANTVFQDPDFGALMVRVTDGNTNPKQLNGYFRNPETETNAWSADGRKFFLVGQGKNTLAFGFDPSTMLIGPLPGAGTSPELVFVQNDPNYDFVHSDPRYRAIIKTMGLPRAY